MHDNLVMVNIILFKLYVFMIVIKSTKGVDLKSEFKSANTE